MKRLLTTLMAAIMLLLVVACGGKGDSAQTAPDQSGTAAAEQTEPEETPAEPEEEAVPDDGYIHIKTCEDFLRIADDPAGKYILDEDLDDWWGGQSTVFRPIGTPEEPFTGELNGNGHSITGTLAYSGQDEAWGFFGCNAGYIHDLTVGYVISNELFDRYGDYEDPDRTYTSVDAEAFPEEKTQYYGVLCGVNRGTIENVATKDHTSMPDMNLLRNENEHICLGIVCGRNEGVISGVDIRSSLYYRSLDKTTAAAIGLVCGYQTAEAVLEHVSIASADIKMDGWIESPHFAPAVYAGLLIGEAEGGTTVRGPIALEEEYRVGADYSFLDGDFRLGGLIGWAHGDIELSGIRMNDLRLRVDGGSELEDYAPAASNPIAGGGLIGWADGNVTLSDIEMTDVAVDVIRREGGDPLPVYAGGCVGYCGGELSAASIRMGGEYSSADAEPEQGDGYGGGLCGYCAGGAYVTESVFSVRLSPIFNGDTLYEANVLGYICGDASFDGVQADCGTNEYTGESSGHSIIANSFSTYYLAALAGCAESEVTVQNCVIDVQYDVMGSCAALYSGGDEGFYNPR